MIVHTDHDPAVVELLARRFGSAAWDLLPASGVDVEELREHWRMQARAVLSALSDAGYRLLPPGGETVGPLAAEEWCSLRSGTDDDPLRCCADTDSLREAAFGLLSMGAGVEWSLSFNAAWHRMAASHPETTLAHHPVVGKLYRAYVEGREPAASDEELATWQAETFGGTHRAWVEYRCGDSTGLSEAEARELVAAGRPVECRAVAENTTRWGPFHG